MMAEYELQRIKERSKFFNKYNSKLAVLLFTALAASIIYLFFSIDMKYFEYAMELRLPKLAVMLIVAFAIGSASMVFQSIINTTIVTPCLLGMNSLYAMIHTVLVFVLGSSSVLVRNSNISFLIDVTIMELTATVIYSYLFKKTKHNVLYILLSGTIMATLFTSIQSTLVRIMDPNEYETLLTSLFANFSNVNSEIILLSLPLMAMVIFALRKELKLLDVITLGKDQAINLGVDYDKTIRRLLLGVVLFIAIATAMVGPISFLGLIIANLSRQLFKTYRHQYLILGSAFIGMVVLIGGQIIVEHIAGLSIPVSVFITIGGGLYFLYLLIMERRA